MSRLIRDILIINMLSGKRKYIPADELIDALNLKMEMRGFPAGMTIRTLQRDIRDIELMFRIEIKNRRGFGYYIAEKDDRPDIIFEELLLNFDLLTSVSNESHSAGYILPEHHRPKGSELMAPLIKAIKDCETIKFNYTFYRKGNRVRGITAQPHFLKQSLGLWYLLAFDETKCLKSYGIDRISELEFTGEQFKRDMSVNTNEMYKDCYGIWDAPGAPVEEVELSYSPLDGSFLKAYPLHSSQEILEDNDKEFRIRLKIKVTNDFVMGLLSRSKSLTVIRPLSLREHIRDIYREALERNK